MSQKLLEKIDVIEVSVAEEFVAEKKFVAGNGTVAWMSSEFKGLVLGTVEPPMPAGKVRVSRLVKSSVDGPILKELSEGAKIALAHFYSVLEQLAQKARAGEQIPYWLICYVIDGWAFHARWRDGGWGLFVYSVSDPDPWYARNHFLSRDS